MEEKKTALVADPNLIERAQIEELLSSAGFIPTAAEDASALVELAERQRPSVVLLAQDFGGPEGGLTLCRHLKASPHARALPLVLICGRERLGFQVGAEGAPDEILLRPIHPPEVLVRLAAVRRLQRFSDELVHGSKLDTLTGTFNNGYLLDRLRHEVLRASRYGRSLAIILVDIDRFGSLNATRGTTYGDLVLREVARALTSNLRGVDLVARTGADGFSVVLPETSLLVARPIGERLRAAIESLGRQMTDEENAPLEVTASFGIAGLPHPEIVEVTDLLRCARQALKGAQEAGGNTTALY
jgi:diguanylate cyclase (GGDEF)-like protein